MYTLQDWRNDTRAAHDTADRICKAIRERQSKLARLAGLDPQYPAHHAHNAVVGLENGNPWPGVDYSLARQILWLSQRQSEVRRVADKRSRRLWNKYAHANGCAVLGDE